MRKWTGCLSGVAVSGIQSSVMVRRRAGRSTQYSTSMKGSSPSNRSPMELASSRRFVSVQTSKPISVESVCARSALHVDEMACERSKQDTRRGSYSQKVTDQLAGSHPPYRLYVVGHGWSAGDYSRKKEDEHWGWCQFLWLSCKFRRPDTRHKSRTCKHSYNRHSHTIPDKIL